MFYSVLLYFIFVLPISIRRYKSDGRDYLFSKIINSIISLFVFVLLAGNLKRCFFGLTDDSFAIMQDVSTVQNVVFSLLYGVLFILVVVQVIRLAMRIEKARVLFLRIIPLLWLFLEVDKYFIYITMNGSIPSNLHITISSLLSAILWGGIFVFYIRKNTKTFLETNFKE